MKRFFVAALRNPSAPDSADAILKRVLLTARRRTLRAQETNQFHGPAPLVSDPTISAAAAQALFYTLSISPGGPSTGKSSS